MLVKCLGNNTPTPSPPLKFQKLNQMSDSESGKKLRKKNLVKFLGDADRSPNPRGPPRWTRTPEISKIESDIRFRFRKKNLKKKILVNFWVTLTPTPTPWAPKVDQNPQSDLRFGFSDPKLP